MKSQFLIAFQEICKEKNLPADTVLDALRSALVSAYRRDNGVSSSQEVSAEIDPRTGEVLIFAEKEIVTDHVIDERTEILLSAARRINPNAEEGEMIMADSTPRNFGRIAAQTAKQVILQRVREAERDHLFDEFSGREGEIVNGTVQSVSGGNITIGLGRTEAILPRSQQVPGERYRAHDKIRIYILEVRRTNRGPQIFVSRSHRNLLRRLLELEVPDIYNGQVDIKSIAREAGARSKVAVQAMQPGVDPVGACVGMRGVRIQSIVRELSDEKIDVIEWDVDPKNFIAKALSPARVSQVFLDDDPQNGRTATVIVPDDQLSLAIGREGQNARLAAKLTGWRIDIKSLTEAGRDSLNLLGDPAADPRVAQDEALHELVRAVIAKKEANRPITAEDYGHINRLVMGIEGRVIAARARAHDSYRQVQSDAHGRVPVPFWEMELEELNLLVRVHNLLLDSGYKTVGDVAFQYELDSELFYKIAGFDPQAMENIVERIAELTSETDLSGIGMEEEEESLLDGVLDLEDAAALGIDAGDDEEDPIAAMVAEAAAGDVEEPEAAVEAAAEDDDFGFDMSELVDAVDATRDGEEPAYAPIEYDLDPSGDDLFAIDEDLLAAAVAEAKGDEDEEAEEPSVLDDLSQSLVNKPVQKQKPKPQKPNLRVRRVSGGGGGETRTDDESKDDATKRRSLILDEKSGRVLSQKKRKQNRRRQSWFSDDD